MGDTAECHIIDEDEDDGDSAHSAISNASDFDEDEEVDYLALELVHHLPAEKATKLLKNMRAKEKAVQDLFHRNKMLLDSCQKLDEENQVLSERLKEVETAEPEPVAAPAVQQPCTVDNSVFLKLERGKEEQILALKKENERLVAQVRRLDEGGQRLEEALAQARREMKKLQQGRQRVDAAGTAVGWGASSPGHSELHGALEEEERLYQELQGETANDIILLKMQQRQAENRTKVQSVLQALLSDDLQRIQHWSSDVTAVLLAVEGVEAQLKHGGKEPKASKKGKAVIAPGQGGNSISPLSSEQVSEVSAKVLDDYAVMRHQIEEIEKVQLSLEQTARGIQDGADSAVAAMDLDKGIEAAELEAEWIRERNASWVERAQVLSLEPMVALLGRTEEAIQALLSNAPPGLIPPHADACLRETCQRTAELSVQLGGQARTLATLQDESISFGRRVKVLQAAHRTLRSELRCRVSEELQKSGRAMEEPLERMRVGLRRQTEVMTGSRTRVSGALQGLAAAAVRQHIAGDAASVSGAEPRPSGEPALTEAVSGEFRQVRALGKALISNLEDGARALEERMEQVLTALYGEAPGVCSGKGRTGPSRATGAPAVESGGGEQPQGAAAEAKRKKAKKKARHEADHPPCGAGQGAAPSAAVEESGRDDRFGASPSTAGPSNFKPKLRTGTDEDSQLRAEFHDAFKDKKGTTGGKKGDASPGKFPAVLTGPELLHELQSLRSDAEALETRMAERLRARAHPAAEGESAASGAARPKAARRKKMYV